MFERLSRLSGIAVKILAVLAVVLLVAQARGDEPAEAARPTVSHEDLNTKLDQLEVLNTKLDQLLFRSRPDLIVEVDSVTQFGTYGGEDPWCQISLKITNTGGGATLFNTTWGITVQLYLPDVGGFEVFDDTSFQMPLNGGDIFAGDDASVVLPDECPDPLEGTVTVDPTSSTRPMGRFPELDEDNNTTHFTEPVIGFK